MKAILFFAVAGFAITSCGDRNTEQSPSAVDSPDTSVIQNTPAPEAGAGMDTVSVPGKGTNGIPSRTGTTGQGNTSVTGSATGSPTGTGKDSTKK